MQPVLILLLFLSAAFGADGKLQSVAAQPPAKQFAFFNGQWSCDGYFVRNRKPIEADLSFETTLDGKWVIFRHDDRPPFNYHALSEWGWSDRDHALVSTVQDSTGGLRIFHSSGWRDSHLTWDGDDPESTPDQRFDFERTTNSKFTVSYLRLVSGEWVEVDRSICTLIGPHAN